MLHQRITTVAIFITFAAFAARSFGATSLPKTFELPSMTGKAATDYAKTRKKVTLVNFWASWCGPCLNELPSISELYKSYSAKGFEVVLINIEDDPKEQAPATLEKLKLPFGSYWDDGGKLQKLFGVSSVPYTAILDKNNKILFEEKNTREWNTPEMRKKIEGWLK